MKQLDSRHLEAMELILAGTPIVKVAEQIGVNRRTIHRWMNEPLFKQHMNNMIVNESKHRLGEVIDAQIREAIKGNAASAKLVLEAHGVIGKQEKVEVNVNANSVDYDKIREKLKERQSQLKDSVEGQF